MTRNGGRTVKPLIQYDVLNTSPVIDDDIIFLGGPVTHMPDPVDPAESTDFFWVPSAELVAEDTTRVKPAVYGVYDDVTTDEWADFTLTLDFALLPNIDYTTARIQFLGPQQWVVFFAQIGEYPKLLRTYDAGQNWIELSLSGLFAGHDAIGYFAEASFPGTIEEKRDAFLAQPGIEEYVNIFLFTDVKVLSMRRVLIRTYYCTDQGTETFQTNVTVVDVDAGAVVDSWSYADQLRSTEVLGTGAWLTWEPDTFSFTPEYEITQDAGGGFTTQPVDENIFRLSVAVGAYRDLGGGDEDFPIVYFTYTNGAVRELWATEDLFVTLEKQSDIGPIVNTADFGSVTWVGNPQLPAPMDPRFPWRLDNRVGTPAYWLDGVTLP